MKVILTQDVPELGEAGEIKQVSTGYARNYLIPQGLAAVATPGAIKTAQAQLEARRRREALASEQAAALAERMASVTLVFEAKAGPTGRLYGSVTTADLAASLERELGVPFDKRKITSGALREVGEHTVLVQLSQSVVGEAQAVVRAEDQEAELPEEPIVEDVEQAADELDEASEA